MIPTTFTCITNASTTICTTATSTPIYTGPTYNEWLFVSCVVIFLISPIFWYHAFSFIKRFSGY